jgi:hypothetical protein
MKSTLLALVTLVLLSACSKSDDQPKPAATPTIVGVWTNSNPADRNPTFTTDSTFWSDGLTAERYALKSDTVLTVYPDNSTWPRLTYSVSADNQTLTLVDFWARTPATYIYSRVNTR